MCVSLWRVVCTAPDTESKPLAMELKHLAWSQ